MGDSKIPLEDLRAVRPQIPMDAVMADRVAVAGDALARAHEIYVRGGTIMQAPAMDEGADRVRIAPHTSATLRSRASVTVCYTRTKTTKTGEETVEVAMPQDDALAILQSAHWPDGVRIIDRVSSTPLLLPSGRVVSEPGYDADARAWMVTDPIQCDGLDASGAVDVLWDLVDQVPWGDSGRDGPAFAAWVAGLLTPFAAALYQGPAPALLIEANVQGTGKTRLAKVLQRIAFNRIYAASPIPRSDAGQKRLFAMALDGVPCVFMDNLKGKISSPLLEAQMTSTVCSERIMREHRYEQVQWAPLWLLTGNNARLSRDMSDRLMRCQLISPHESPRSLGGWRIEDHEKYIAERLEQLQRASLSLLRAAQVAGWPKPSAGLWGSFEGWSAIVLSALELAGLADPREAAVEELDEETDQLAYLTESWPDGLEMSAANVAQIVQDRAVGSTLADAQKYLSPEREKELVEALITVCGGRNAHAIGLLFSQMMDRWVAGRRLIRCARSRAGRRWTVEWTLEAKQALKVIQGDFSEELPF